MSEKRMHEKEASQNGGSNLNNSVIAVESLGMKDICSTVGTAQFCLQEKLDDTSQN